MATASLDIGARVAIVGDGAAKVNKVSDCLYLWSSVLISSVPALASGALQCVASVFFAIVRSNNSRAVTISVIFLARRRVTGERDTIPISSHGPQLLPSIPSLLFLMDAHEVITDRVVSGIVIAHHQHRREYDVEKQWCDHATLAEALLDLEPLRVLVTMLAVRARTPLCNHWIN